MFQLPTRRSRQELRRLAGTLAGGLKNLAMGWAGVPMRLAAAEYHRTLGPGGVPAVESSYDPNALAGRGPLLADVAAFHKAFSYAPDNPPAEVPDHIAAELDFLSYLAFKAAFAMESGNVENARIVIKAYQTFLDQHVFTWVDAFRERLAGSESFVFIHAARQIGAAPLNPPTATTPGQSCL